MFEIQDMFFFVFVGDVGVRQALENKFQLVCKQKPRAPQKRWARAPGQVPAHADLFSQYF